MRNLLQLLWTDCVGSSISTEMALVTSVTVGALAMGMAEFSATVNREFQDAAVNTGLVTIDEAAAKKKSEEDAEKRDEKKSEAGWRFRRAKDQKKGEAEGKDQDSKPRNRYSST